MKIKFFKVLALVVVATMSACGGNTPEDKDPEGTLYYTESFENFANPERGFYRQTYYKSSDLASVLNPISVERFRTGDEKSTLYLHSYYLTDYIESDIAQEFLDRLQANMDALRQGGGKAIVRFSYKSSEKESNKPWDATPEWAHRHIDQLTPYLQANSDVILCLQCGFIGVWGEWYYTTGFPRNPNSEETWAPRWELIHHLMQALPADRQIALRTPGYKMKYLSYNGYEVTPISADEAYGNTTKARLCGHNDCFVSSNNDVGTYSSTAERDFWAEDTKYTFMGGETCHKCKESLSENALNEMAKYHWTYLCNSYHPDILNLWQTEGSMDEIKRRLGYRLVLDKCLFTQEPKAGEAFMATVELRNVGFAAPVNKRGIELIFVSKTNPAEKYVFDQSKDNDPRFWMAGETSYARLRCTLDTKMHGEYNVYLNLPDPYASLHDNPAFSIRLANENVWEEATGYNKLGEITL